MAKNPLQLLAEAGQSVWLDDLTRAMIQDGSLQALIESGVTGITSNPAILEKAMTESDLYDPDIRRLAEGGHDAQQIYEALAVEDIRSAADLLRGAHERSNGTDGFVSLEVSPLLARDTRGTLDEARRLWKRVDRENVFIKIPGTAEGIPAVESCLSEGINVNVTLLFSLEAYREVMEAHLRALEARRNAGLPLGGVASVASFFLSRIDSKVDPRLDAIRSDAAAAWRGTAAVASARIAYQMWKGLYSGPRWRALADAGARFQKPLWASTSTKDKSYPDLKYVETLIGPHTINTIPGSTLEAFRDHGRVALTVETELDAARAALTGLESLGITMKQVTDELVAEGIDKFKKPYESLLATLEGKRRALVAG